MKPLLITTLVLASALPAFAQYTGIQDAIPIAVPMAGTTKNDGWYNLTTAEKTKTVDGTSYTIPGNIGYPTVFASASKWSAPILSQVQSDSANRAALTKVANGNGTGYATGFNANSTVNSNATALSLAGFNTNGTEKIGSTWSGSGMGPYPAGDGLYPISFSNVANARGGTLGVFEATPVLELSTVVFQLEIGSANGYDLWNHATAGLTKGALTSFPGGPALTLTLSDSSTVTLAATYFSLIEQGFNGTAQMPTGPNGELQDEPIWINNYGFQWDVSAYTNITAFNVSFSVVEHSPVYSMRLDQSSAAYGASVLPIAAVPEPHEYAFAVTAVLGVMIFLRRRRNRA